MIGLLMSGCAIKKNDHAADDSFTIVSNPFIEEAEAPEYEICSFADGLDRFIECYNICCTAYGNTNLLITDSGWNFSDGCWHYRQYENNWLEPEIEVYLDENDAIREIRIGYEDHGYTEWGEALSKERSFYTLRCLHDEQSDDGIRMLIEDVESDMKKSSHYVELGESPEIIAPISYGDYDIYHFFSAGIYYLCIIPHEQ